MSAVKLKNTIVRTLAAAITSGALPKGVVIEGRLKDRRIWIDIVDAPFQVMKPENIRIDRFGISYSVSIMSGPDKDHTPEGCALLAQVKAIALGAYPEGRGMIVHFSSRAYASQGQRMRKAAAEAAQAAGTLTAPAAPDASGGAALAL